MGFLVNNAKIVRTPFLKNISCAWFCIETLGERKVFECSLLFLGRKHAPSLFEVTESIPVAGYCRFYYPLVWWPIAADQKKLKKNKKQKMIKKTFRKKSTQNYHDP